MIEQVMGDDEMSVSVAYQASVVFVHIDLLAAVIDAFHLLRSEKDVVIVHLRAEWPRRRGRYSILDKQDTGLSARVRLERVRV